MQLKEKTANVYEYKVGNIAIIAIFVCLWKPRMWMDPNVDVNQRIEIP